MKSNDWRVAAVAVLLRGTPMPDDWEGKNGLDPAKDDSAKVMPGGYTAIEVYVNELADSIVKER